MHFDSIDELVAAVPTTLGVTEWITISQADVADVVSPLLPGS